MTQCRPWSGGCDGGDGRFRHIGQIICQDDRWSSKEVLARISDFSMKTSLHTIPLTATMNALLRTVGQDALSIANILGTNASGNALSHRHVGIRVRSCLKRSTKLATNMRAHNVVSGGTVAGGILRMDRAEDDGILFWAEGESTSDASPKAGSPVRCLLRCEVLRLDMELLVERHSVFGY
jgi:hypothetical protein